MKIIGLLLFGFMSFMAPSDGLSQKELNKNTAKSIIIESDINIMTQQAEKYERIGNYKAASLIWEQLAKYAEENFIDDNALISRVFNILGQLYFKQAQYSKSEQYFSKSLLIINKSEEINLFAADIFTNLSLLNTALDRYDKAEFFALEAIAIYDQFDIIDKEKLIEILNNLANIYYQKGSYNKAEQMLDKALGIGLNSKGKAQFSVAITLNNLAGIYMAQGQRQKAQDSYEKSLLLSQKILGPNHPDVAKVMFFLAQFYSQQESTLKKARILFTKSLKISRNSLGNFHSDIANTLGSLSIFYISEKMYKEAELFNLESLKIRQKLYGVNHSSLSYNYETLSNIYIKQGRFLEANKALFRALKIKESILGVNPIAIAESLIRITRFYNDQGYFKLGIPYLSRAISIETDFLINQLPFLPSEKRVEFTKTIGNTWEIPFGLSYQFPIAAHLAIETRLNRHGLMQEIEQRQTLLLNSSDILEEKVKQLQLATQQLASVILSVNQRSNIKKQYEILQAEIYSILPNLEIKPVTVSMIANLLPTSGALIEFQRYRPFDGAGELNKRWGKAQYMALILKPNGSIVAVPLGAASSIDGLIQKGIIASAFQYEDATLIWKQLSTQIFTPLLPYLSSSEQWFISPDSELNRVPFAALPAPQKPNQTLAETIQLRLVTTGRELIRLQQDVTLRGPSLVVANPNFDKQDVTTLQDVPSNEIISSQRRSSDLSNNQWARLPGSEIEGQQIAELLSTKMISGTAATTAVMQQQQAPLILHVATHGFFVADQTSKSLDLMSAIQDEASQLRAFRQEDPLLRSGLVFAGANQPTLDPNDDGYLTSSEALNLNLKGTELVVLSACSTGQGEIRTGEGVYGLQRSLTVAGARSTLLSLWKVDDAATVDFMVRFYKRLKTGEGRSDALAAVQKEFRNSKIPAWRHPYYWAAWQLVGDWKPIQGL